ncbi:MAG: acetyl-CoA acetyltransferase [Halieaceae bacterium]|nr:acetyl-CoA acetyltransferase [Halieaceae bacterium]
MNEARMPVLVGCGQITDRRGPADASSPVGLMAEAARRAAIDSGPGEAMLKAIDTVVAVELIVDSPETGSGARGMYKNVPQTVCNLLQIDPPTKFYTRSGGNTPQMLVNRFSQDIAQGRTGTVLLTGAEALKSMIGRLKQGLPMNGWSDDPGGEPELLGDFRPPVTEHERDFGLHLPSTCYPLFENALRGKNGWSLEEHRRRLGELFQRYCEVAAENPLSWFPALHTAQEIATPSDTNRYVGFPYTKYLNSVIQTNQGAALILTSLARARELGVSEDRMVYLHGCGDANDIWNVTDRVNFHSSPAIRAIGEQAFAMAGKTVEDMDFFDIYSCFPSAVQIACDELGIALDDPRGLTVTGGLPYFGGPGNNYVMHSIATMMDRLREKPGTFGLLNANGWFVTKHALGIYSTTPLQRPWQREDPASYQQSILNQDHPSFTEDPEGPARVETYTVLHTRKGVERGLIVGRLEDGTRFLAETPSTSEVLQNLMQRDALGMRGTVSKLDGKNIFIPV